MLFLTLYFLFVVNIVIWISQPIFIGTVWGVTNISNDFPNLWIIGNILMTSGLMSVAVVFGYSLSVLKGKNKC
jgi:hypothetical protein